MSDEVSSSQMRSLLPKKVSPSAMNRLLRETAKEMCGAFYEACERSPRFRRDAPPIRQFIRVHWPKYVAQARLTLAVMLRSRGRSQAEKDEIYDALLGDQAHRTLMPSADTAEAAMFENALALVVPPPVSEMH